jgi:putative heme-binding domain-containing protein
LLVRNWRSFGPGLRTQVLDVLLRRGEWQNVLFDAIERSDVAASEIGAAQRQRLLDQGDSALRARAARLLAGAVDADREKVVRAYQSVLTKQGDPARGLAVFTKLCATCHRLGGVGHEVGPDLASVGDKSPAALLIAILDPNRSVEARYINYLAVTKNGVTLTGVLTSETGTSITLLGPDGKQQVILRTELEQLTSTGKSAMPEGLEKDLQLQDVADLIAHVRSATPRPAPKSFAGNQPGLVRPDADGSLRLPASAAAIYGSTLVLEPQHGNLGYWSTTDDHVVWTMEVPRAGRYAVWFDWACADDCAGNAWVLDAGLERLNGKVESTGSWEEYRQAKVGTIALQAGRQELALRAVGRIRSTRIDRGSLINLKAIRVVPSPE